MGRFSETRASPESRCATMRNVIVTGGSRGLGLGIARKLIDAAFRAIVIARKQGEELAARTSAIEQTHTDALHFVPFDLAQIEPIPDPVKKLGNQFGPIYGLVNNAAMEMTSGLSLEDRTNIARRTTLRRRVEVDDVANAVEILMSEGSKSITGTVITVDAGNTA
jgi:3-oxoacyl-[acyl-carrier protein] reductase